MWWIFTSVLFWKLMEGVAMVTGLVYVLLEVKKSGRMWYWMIASSIFNLAVFAHRSFLSMTLIQAYYIVTAVYGIIKWRKIGSDAGSNAEGGIVIAPFERKKAAMTIGIAASLFALLASVSLHNYVPAAGDIPGKPYWDSAVAVLSMLATYWLSQSWYAQWYVWAVVNVTAIVMFLYPVFTGHPENALPLIGVLYALYMITTIVGMVNWKKHGVIVKRNPEQI